MRNTVTTGDQIAYTQAFLRQIGGNRENAQRRGRIVATVGETFQGVTYWKTGALLPCSADLVYVQWSDTAYPKVDADTGESSGADLVRSGNVCRVRSAAFVDS